MVRSKSRDRSVLVVTFLIVLAAILIGCGGGGGGSSSTNVGSSATAGPTTGSGTASGGSTSGTTAGQAVFNLQWPAFTRGIPSYARSVNLTVKKGTTEVASKTINRTSNLAYTQAITFNDLAAGTYIVVGNAYLENGATGPVLATFSATFTVSSGAKVNPPVAFSSTIADVVIDGAPFVMLTGVTTQLTGHAIDTNGNIMLLPPDALQWVVVEGPNLVDITKAGFCSALAPGTVTVRLVDSESHEFAEVSFEIQGEPITTGGTGTDGGSDTATTGTETSDTGSTDAGSTDAGTDGSTDGSTTGGTTSDPTTGTSTGTTTTGTSDTGTTGTTGTSGGATGTGAAGGAGGSSAG